MTDLLKYVQSGFSWVYKTKLLGMNIPLIGGIAINDRCNLHCRHCAVSNRNLPDLTFEEIKNGLRQLRAKGIRTLYIEGGEPFLWKDDGRNLNNIILFAKNTGFVWIVVYTNGTLPIATGADTVFVSLDGLKETHDRIRGKTYNQIIKNIRQSKHPSIYVNFTINTLNQQELEPFCEEISKVDNIRGVCFYLYTPLYPDDSLLINETGKVAVVRRILALKKTGFNIMNSKTALRGLLLDRWKRPDNMGYLFAEGKMYECCRYNDNPESCKNCGYLGFYELFYISRLNPGAVLTALKYLQK